MKEFAALQDMSQMPVMERLLNALIVTALGMGITFIVLIALLYAIKFMSSLLNPRVSPTELVAEKGPEVKEPVIEASHQEDEEELVAVLIAAIASASGRGYEEIKIRGFKEVGVGIPLWSQAGVLETMNREI